MNDQHHPKVVKNWGVNPDTVGLQTVRIRGFRGHCEDCGELGAFRTDAFKALADVAKHSKGKPFPVPRQR